MKSNYFNSIAAIFKESPVVDIENLQGETNPLDVDPIAFINVWSSDSVPSKASKSSHNRPFIHFDEAKAKFRRLVFNQPLENSLSNPDYKPQLQQSINEVFKFNDLVVDEIKRK